MSFLLKDYCLSQDAVIEANSKKEALFKALDYILKDEDDFFEDVLKNICETLEIELIDLENLEKI